MSELPPHEAPIDFPTLLVALDWIQEHCVIPDGFHKGEPYILSDWQARFLAHFYRIKPAAVPADLAMAFTSQVGLLVLAQKTGKGPVTAAHICLEAVGPSLFAGWAKGGETYRCIDHGCPCGWVYVYEAGEPMGMARPTPLIQVVAFSEEQTGNIYDALRPMIEEGPLSLVLPKTTEGFIRLPGGGRIDTVTSSARSRLGQRVTFIAQDETGIWTAANKMQALYDNQRRGLGGMNARLVQTTNAWDPAENSVAQTTYESSSPDILKWYPVPPKHLNYKLKEDRRKIHEFNYAGSPWVNLDAIEAVAVELLERDPGQAERFFGNRIVAGAGSWLDRGRWELKAEPKDVPPRGTQVVLGFDGSSTDDWTAIRAQTRDGYQFTPLYGPARLKTIWNPAEYDGTVPRLEVAAAVDELMQYYDVIRMYCDPPYWESEIDTWAERYGEKKVIRWSTYRITQMHDAAERMKTDILAPDSAFRHDGCPIVATHIANLRMAARTDGRYTLTKPSQAQKIDAGVTSIICHEAWGDATSKQLWKSEHFVYLA